MQVLAASPEQDWTLSVTCTCRRKGREAKKFSKAVQAERLKEKAQSKKAGVDAITRLRKQRQRQGFAGVPTLLGHTRLVHG